MRYEIITPPDAPVVSISEIKEHLRIIHDLDNDKLEALALAAETYIENETRRFFLERTAVAYFDAWEDVKIEHRPNVTVTMVSYYDEDDTLNIVAASDYTVSNTGLDTVITMDEEPALTSNADPIVVNYTVGYSAVDEYGANTVPDLIKFAIKSLVAHWYTQPEMVVTGKNVSEMPLHLETILNQYRIVEV